MFPDDVLGKLIDKIRDGLEYLPTGYGLLRETKVYKESCEVSLDGIGDEFAGLSLIVYKTKDQALTAYLCGFIYEKLKENIVALFVGEHGGKTPFKNKEGKFVYSGKQVNYLHYIDIEYGKYGGNTLISKAHIFGSDEIYFPVLYFPNISLNVNIFEQWKKKASIQKKDINSNLYEFFVRFVFVTFETLRNPALKHIVEYGLFNGSGFKDDFVKEIANNYSKSLSKQLTLSIFDALKNIGYTSFSNYINSYHASKDNISTIKANDNDKKFYYAFCRLHLLQEYAMKEGLNDKEIGKLQELFGLNKAGIDELFNFGDGNLKNNLNCILLIEMFLHIKFIFGNGVDNLSAKSIIESYTKSKVDSLLFIEPLLKLMSKEWESNGILSSYDHGEAGYEYSEQQKTKERRNLIKVLGDLGNKACEEYLKRQDKSQSEYYKNDRIFCEMLLNKHQITCKVFLKLGNTQIDKEFKEKFSDVFISYFAEKECFRADENESIILSYYELLAFFMKDFGSVNIVDKTFMRYILRSAFVVKNGEIEDIKCDLAQLLENTNGNEVSTDNTIQVVLH